MPIRNALASLAVTDLDSALPWYERLLGRPADSRPMAEVAEWKFEGGGWLQVYQRPKRAGLGSVTLAVTDIEAQQRWLEACGINLGEQSAGPKVKTLMITDPAGNHIAFAQAIDPGIAQ
ncbi:MAG: VOC family protein [Rubritepida sp.]|nr:VOC family protein [Rubritepida sp.]